MYSGVLFFCLSDSISYVLNQFTDVFERSDRWRCRRGVREGDIQTGVKQIRGKKQSDIKVSISFCIKRHGKRESELCRESRRSCSLLVQETVGVVTVLLLTMRFMVQLHYFNLYSFTVETKHAARHNSSISHPKCTNETKKTPYISQDQPYLNTDMTNHKHYDQHHCCL